MLNSLIRLALRYRAAVVLLSVLVLVCGGYLTSTLPIDVLPNLDRPRVVVMTEAENLRAEEVEKLISHPIERALLGASGVQAVRSESSFGLSVVTAEFDWGAPIHIARQTVTERLASIQSVMPRGVKPQLQPIGSIMSQIMLVGMHYVPGPNDGELAVVGKTDYVAELVHVPATQEVTLRLWNPRGPEHERISDPKQWQPLRDVAAQPLTLTWQAGEPGKNGADPRVAATLHFSPDGSFTGKVETKLDKDTAWNATERRVTVTVDNKKHAVVFLPFTRRQMELRTAADKFVHPKLMVAGVAQVTVMGGGRKQYQVLVDPEALIRYDVSLHQVEHALEQSNLNASGGIAVGDEKEKAIQIIGQLGPEPGKVIEELEMIVVKTAPKGAVLLKKVARIVERPQFKRGDASVNGYPGVVLKVDKQPSYDTRRVTSVINDVLKDVEETLPATMTITGELFQMKNFIDRAVFNVGEALVIGAVLVLLILFLFLLNFRTTFISLTAIPLSLVLTGVTFKLFGWLTGADLTINIMTLGGIAVAMGELVDDAIVDVENIFRRLRENRLLPRPRSSLRVIYEASLEIRSAIVFGTIVVILVFLPLFAIPGIVGQLFPPLAAAYIVSILASLLVSLTVTPVLCSYLLPHAKATHRTEDSPLLRWLKRQATHLVRLSMAVPGLLLSATWFMVGLSAVLLTLLGADLLPKFNEGSVQIDLTLPPESSLEASNRACDLADAVLRGMRKSAANPNGDILHFERRTGRAELDDHVEPVCNSEYVITVNPACKLSRKDLLDKITAALTAEVPDATVEQDQPLGHLIGHMLSGSKREIGIKIFGEDLTVLRGLGEKVKTAAGKVRGIKTPAVEGIEEAAEIHLLKIPEQLAAYQMTWEGVCDFLTTALKGKDVTQVIDGPRRIDVVLKLDDGARTDYQNLLKLRVELPNKSTVPLSELVAQNNYASGPNEVKRDNTRRRLVVRCSTEGRDQASAVAELKERIRADVRLPAGYHIEYTGQFQSQAEATRMMLGLSVISLVCMFCVLYYLFPSARIVLQILNALPTAFIGGVLALVVTRQAVTVASMVGFISLGGIAVRNGILLVSHYFHLMRHEGEKFTQEMVLRGSLERLSPVLMTALTAGIGLVPLVLGGNQPGREILYPVATVILGGLVTSTLCEFLIHPGLFWAFSGKDADRLAHHKTEEQEVLTA